MFFVAEVVSVLIYLVCSCSVLFFKTPLKESVQWLYFVRFWLIFVDEPDSLVAIDVLIKVIIATCLVLRWLSMALQEPHGEEGGISGDTIEIVNTVFNFNKLDLDLSQTKHLARKNGV